MDEADYSTEIWKAIPFAPDYEVSSRGTVRRTVAKERCQAGRIIKTSLAGPRRNYVYIRITHGDGVRRSMGLHCVMLETFVGPKPTKKHEGGHRDGDSRNNVLSNLKWCLPKENSHDRTIHGTQARGDRHGISKITAEQARMIYAATGSQTKIAKSFGISQGAVSLIKLGKTWRHVTRAHST